MATEQKCDQNPDSGTQTTGSVPSQPLPLNWVDPGGNPSNPPPIPEIVDEPFVIDVGDEISNYPGNSPPDRRGAQKSVEELQALEQQATPYGDEKVSVLPAARDKAEIQHDGGEDKWYEAEIKWDKAKLETRTQKGLRDYLQGFFGEKPLIRDIASVLIPGALAAFLFPVFGPVVAAGAVAVAVKNGLELLKINVSDQTVNALFKPFENRPLDGSDVQSILADTLKNLLPRDKEVNKELTEVVEVKIIPEIREVALERLRSSLEVYFKEQSWLMAERAVELSKLVEC